MHLYVLHYFICWKNFLYSCKQKKKSKHKQNKTKQNKSKQKQKQKQNFLQGSLFWLIESDCPHGFLRGRTVGWKKNGVVHDEPSTRTIFILIFGLQVKKAFRTLNMHSWVVMYTYNSKFRHIYNCCYVFGQACILFLIKMTVGTE